MPIIPFGLGSGFEGGITAPHGGVTLNLRRMNQGWDPLTSHNFDNPKSGLGVDMIFNFILIVLFKMYKKIFTYV